MRSPHPILPRVMTRVVLAAFFAGLLLTGASVWQLTNVSANHPVLVEGERDFDGDGLTGLAEDTDNATDRVFGTITAALGALNGGANQNGRVTIVTSGRFHEQVVITSANGNTTLEAAPGVEANIDAVGTGDRALQFPGSTNAVRQAQPGIIVNAPATRYVLIRNIVSRNWTDGIQVLGTSHVTLDNVEMEGNINHGIQVLGDSRVSITNARVYSTGRRVGAGTGDFPSAANQPNPGIGIAFRDTSTGTVVSTSVVGSFSTGIANFTGTVATIRVLGLNVFDNSPDFYRVNPPDGSVPGSKPLFVK